MKHNWTTHPLRFVFSVWQRPWGRWSLVVVLSLFLHMGVFQIFQGQANQRPPVRRTYKKIRFRILKPRPRPKQRKPLPPRRKPPVKKKKKKKKRRKKKKKKKKKRRKKRKKQKRRVPPPPPNTTPPRRPPPRDAVPQPVFGVNMSSLGKGKGGRKMRQGNTLMKDPEPNPPRKVAPYQAPRREAPPPPRRATFAPVPLFEIDENPREWKKVRASYPEDAKRDGIEAVVVLSVKIRKNGRVLSARVINVRPPQAKRYAFGKAAVRALRKYRFRPAKAKGNAVDVVVRYIYRFELDD